MCFVYFSLWLSQSPSCKMNNYEIGLPNYLKACTNCFPWRVQLKLGIRNIAHPWYQVISRGKDLRSHGLIDLDLGLDTRHYCNSKAITVAPLRFGPRLFILSNYSPFWVCIEDHSSFKSWHLGPFHSLSI